jgi:hypothetical protein
LLETGQVVDAENEALLVVEDKGIARNQQKTRGLFVLNRL